MTWPSLTQTGIRTSFRAERTLTPNQSVICVEIDLAGPLRRPHETFHSIDVCHDAEPPPGARTSRRAVFPSAKPTTAATSRPCPTSKPRPARTLAACDARFHTPRPYPVKRHESREQPTLFSLLSTERQGAAYGSSFFRSRHLRLTRKPLGECAVHHHPGPSRRLCIS